MMSLARARAVYLGYVQGVGFRYTAATLAEGFRVTGWVRNRADGSVELEVQGDRPEAEAYLEELLSRMAGHVASAEVTWVTPEDGEAGFEIRR